MKSFKELREDAPTNMVGGGHIAGAVGDPPVRKRKPKVIRKRFAECEVFVVNSDTYHSCTRPKLKGERFYDIIGNNHVGTAIREYAKDNPGKGIMIEDENTGYMTWLRIPKGGAKF
jgi:hypothetical protein